ncbi:MAG: cyclase [Planctomycetota bacterium]|jgi:hypothetical protein
MIRMFVRHSVSDFGAWKRSYDAFDMARREMGVAGAGVYQSIDDPLDVTVWHDFSSLEIAQSFARSQRLADVMADAGVVGEPTIWFTTPPPV